ncbi:MAG: transglutaminase family protein [Pseudomonadota bacterium]
MKLQVEHTTHYQYSAPQRMVVQSHRLTPSEADTQRVVNWQVLCDGAIFGETFIDAAGDKIRTMSINRLVEELTIKIIGSVETKDQNGVVKVIGDRLNHRVYLRQTQVTKPSPDMEKALAKFATTKEESSLELAHTLCGFVHEKIAYETESTNSETSAAEAFAQSQGVCQDQTHVLVSMARARGIPARYVAGYLLTDAQGNTIDASHAWAELFIEELGWVGFDPTNACCPDERYIRISSGLDATEAALIRGVSRGSGIETMHTSVQMSDMQQQ